jgi:hypothetical protein
MPLCSSGSYLCSKWEVASRGMLAAIADKQFETTNRGKNKIIILLDRLLLKLVLVD